MLRDIRAMLTIAIAALLGLAIAIATYNIVGDNRTPTMLRWLALVILATPLTTFVGWIVARRSEWRLALASCGAFYFFTPFIAARIETILAPEAAAQTVGPHTVYFTSVLILHAIGGLALAWWRGQAKDTNLTSV
ncbi:hypothetical protein [Chloroflexus sp.]|uniref:hypothetical protein n=1 Tax=Chloroflexus sp. TaxID=1904827 RepID=UPI0026159071|nr:hypothetical protein [uncultured Chloroflexus sp.]